VPPSAVHLQVATNILDGTLRSAGINQARAACWVTRRGLEELVSELLCHRSVAVGRGSMRSKLICLSVTYADQPENVAAILMAWDQLSRACHHHAYELTPTSAEARHLIETLRAVT
jgi:hypothetical protein